MQTYVLMVIWIVAVITQVSCRRNVKAIPSHKHHLQHIKKYEVVHVELMGQSPSDHRPRPFRLSTLDSHLDHYRGISPQGLTQFSFSIANRELKAKVRQHHELFAENYREERHVYKDGKLVNVKANKYDSQSCQYTGLIHDSEDNIIKNSDVTINNCPYGYLRGTLRADENYAIAPAHNYLSESQLQIHSRRLQSTHDSEHVNLHIVYKLSDYKDEKSKKSKWCGVGVLDDGNGPEFFDNHGHHHAEYNNQRPKHGRKLTSLKRVGLLIVNDKKRVELDDNGNPENSANAIVAQVQQIYQQGSPFTPRVEFQLVGQITFQHEMPFNYTLHRSNGYDEVDVDDALYDFHTWRTTPGAVSIAHDNAQLLSGMDFEDSTLGYAGVGTMCIASASGGIDMTHEWAYDDQGVPTITAMDVQKSAAILAHELGHNFGMKHDGTPQTLAKDCSSTGNIMNAEVGFSPPTEFSSCSVEYYNNFVGTETDICLDDKEATHWGDPVCGNGYVERGEQCDCGAQITMQDGGNPCDEDPCCDGATCRLHPGSQCSETDPCCNKCNITDSSTICRDASSQCDVIEYCDGTRSSCPLNVFKGSGLPCDDSSYGDGVCYGGVCQSILRQCNGEKFSDQVWVDCSVASDLLAGNPSDLTGDGCGDLQCCNSQGQKYTFPSGTLGGGNLKVTDGVLCGTSKQCFKGTCQQSNAINSKHKWKPDAWSLCSSCDGDEVRTINCIAFQQSGREIAVDRARCSPGTFLTSRKCSKVNGTLCVHSSNPGEDFAREFAAKFDPLSKAKLIRDLIPRLYGSPNFSYSTKDREYWDGIILLGLIPLLIFVICLIYWLCFCFTGKGCGAREHHEKHTCCEKGIREACLLFLTTIAFVFGIIIIFYSFELRRGIIADNGVLILSNEIVNTIPNTLDAIKKPLMSLDEKLGTDSTYLFDTTRQLDVVLLPMENAVVDVETAILGCQDILSKMTPIHSKSWGRNISCGICQDDYIPAFNTLSNINIYDSQASLISARQYISNIELNIDQDSLSSLIQLLDETELKSKSTGETVKKYTQSIKSFEKVRFPIITLLMLVPVLIVFLAIAGFMCKSERLFGWIQNCSWCSLMLLWILLAIHLPLSHTFGDSCEFMSKVEKDPVKMMNFTEMQGEVMITCFADGQASLIGALNYTAEVAFVSSFKNDLKLDPEIDRQIQEMKDQTSRLRDSASTVNTNDFLVLNSGSTVGNSLEPRDKVISDYFWDQFIANLTTLEESIRTLEQSFNNANSEFMHISEGIGELAASGEALKTQAKCGSLGNLYFDFKAVWCDLITTSISLLSFLILLNAILFGPIVYLAGAMKEMETPADVTAEDEGTPDHNVELDEANSKYV